MLVHMRITIPADVEFCDLSLSRRLEDGAVVFAMDPIEAICEASGLELEAVVGGPQPLVGALIAAWYVAHRESGGDPDPVQEDLIEERRLEAERGGGFSYRAGHA